MFAVFQTLFIESFSENVDFIQILAFFEFFIISLDISSELRSMNVSYHLSKF